jgi:hypothetical protein
MADTKLLYSSENGDRWLLVREFGTDRAFVRHEADLASGGRRTDMEMAEFLVTGQAGPEHVALRRLVGKPGTGV